MYTPPLFRADRSASAAFAEARGFGNVCAFDGRKPVSSAVPFCVSYGRDGGLEVQFHVARQNDLVKLADQRATWLMAVTGADAYVSADWYVSPDQVPTWLYQAVHMSGPVRVMSPNELAVHLDDLSDKFEARLAPKPIWKSAKMTAGRLEAMKKAIVGFVMSVEQIEGSFKLNQHKSDVDYQAIASHLSAGADQASQQIGEAMRVQKPHLFAGVTQNEIIEIPEGTT